MKTKNLVPHKVRSSQITYQRMAEMLLNLQVEFQLLADTQPENSKIKATHYSTDDTLVFQFEDQDFYLSLDLTQKGGLQ